MFIRCSKECVNSIPVSRPSNTMGPLSLNLPKQTQPYNRFSVVIFLSKKEIRKIIRETYLNIYIMFSLRSSMIYNEQAPACNNSFQDFNKIITFGLNVWSDGKPFFDSFMFGSFENVSVLPYGQNGIITYSGSKPIKLFTAVIYGFS